MARDKTIRSLMHWHRRLGLPMVLITLILVTTGFMINHTSDLELSDIKIKSTWLLGWYGIKHSQPLTSFEVLPSRFLIASENNQLFINQQLIGDCLYPLKSALKFDQILVALCNKQLLLITEEGALIEAISPAIGLPDQAQQLGMLGDQLVIKTNHPDTGQSVVFNLENLSSKVIANTEVLWAQPTALPANLQQALEDLLKPEISLERLIRDIHSGRILGRFGVILVDIIAISLLILAITGLWSWLRHKKIHKNR